MSSCPPSTRPPPSRRSGPDARRLSADRGGQRIHRRTAAVARDRRRRDRRAPPGFGAACFAGLVAATAGVVCFMDADGSLDPPTWSSWPTPWLRGDRPGPRRPPAERGRGRPTHGLANRALAAECAAVPDGSHDLGPMRAARRPPLLALGIEDRRSGWPLEMVLRAARAGWRIDETSARMRPDRPLQGDGHVRGTVEAVHDMAGSSPNVTAVPTCQLSCWPRRRRRAGPRPAARPPCTPEQAAALAAAALADTLAASGPRPRPPACSWCSKARRGAGCLPASRCAPARRRTGRAPRRGDGRRLRTSAAVPALLIGMDTPQVTVPASGRRPGDGWPAGADAVIGLATDGGYWAVGLQRPARRGLPRRADEHVEHRRRAATAGCAPADSASSCWPSSATSTPGPTPWRSPRRCRPAGPRRPSMRIGRHLGPMHANLVTNGLNSARPVTDLAQRRPAGPAPPGRPATASHTTPSTTGTVRP